MSNIIVNSIFQSFQSTIDSEQDLRDEIRVIVKEMDKHTREITTALQVIHTDISHETINRVCLETRELLATNINEDIKKLSKLVPEKQYYKYNECWKYLMQRLSFLISLLVFMEKGILVEKKVVGEILGIGDESNNHFHLDLEDYLIGLLQLSSELARFSVNSVTNGDYERPLQISKFVAELGAGFRLLNMKNDNLRKRFDGLKYDAKKVEEVVYDLSIRGLNNKTADSCMPMHSAKH